MPIYDYYCDNCQSGKEEVHGFNEKPKVICQKCGGTMKKIISGRRSLKFIGPGFPSNDLREKEIAEWRRK